ncbi:hypothetical protein [Halobaculum magnesiiphilum]|uniref:Copper resistance protein D domain-containing protein n=1 Tax=Halobaculum magnesiiphilum TaxID=1017351 RepID=A0A8T8WAR2_9EURY|nr:hypothetical protein [Halobaculum magnesiiphilum]QZP36911.1 hypothetical protein K6T50_11485 [Halobaculum magnesiiphilum]
MSTALHLAVRTVHLLSMVALVGVSAVAWYAFRTAVPPARARLLNVECAFWGLLGLLLATGVGNVGSLGAPGPGTRWGGLLATKLLVVLGVVLGSFLRTSLVLRAPAGTDLRREPEFGPILEGSYLATTVSLLAVVVLAEVLAHG